MPPLHLRLAQLLAKHNPRFAAAMRGGGRVIDTDVLMGKVVRTPRVVPAPEPLKWLPQEPPSRKLTPVEALYAAARGALREPEPSTVRPFEAPPPQPPRPPKPVRVATLEEALRPRMPGDELLEEPPVGELPVRGGGLSPSAEQRAAYEAAHPRELAMPWELGERVPRGPGWIRKQNEAWGRYEGFDDPVQRVQAFAEVDQPQRGTQKPSSALGPTDAAIKQRQVDFERELRGRGEEPVDEIVRQPSMAVPVKGAARRKNARGKWESAEYQEKPGRILLGDIERLPGGRTFHTFRKRPAKPAVDWQEITNPPDYQLTPDTPEGHAITAYVAKRAKTPEEAEALTRELMDKVEFLARHTGVTPEEFARFRTEVGAFPEGIAEFLDKHLTGLGQQKRFEAPYGKRGHDIDESAGTGGWVRPEGDAATLPVTKVLGQGIDVAMRRPMPIQPGDLVDTPAGVGVVVNAIRGARTSMEPLQSKPGQLIKDKAFNQPPVADYVTDTLVNRRRGVPQPRVYRQGKQLLGQGLREVYGKLKPQQYTVRLLRDGKTVVMHEFETQRLLHREEIAKTLKGQSPESFASAVEGGTARPAQAARTPEGHKVFPSKNPEYEIVGEQLEYAAPTGWWNSRGKLGEEQGLKVQYDDLTINVRRLEDGKVLTIPLKEAVKKGILSQEDVTTALIDRTALVDDVDPDEYAASARRLGRLKAQESLRWSQKEQKAAQAARAAVYKADPKLAAALKLETRVREALKMGRPPAPVEVAPPRPEVAPGTRLISNADAGAATVFHGEAIKAGHGISHVVFEDHPTATPLAPYRRVLSEQELNEAQPFVQKAATKLGRFMPGTRRAARIDKKTGKLETPEQLASANAYVRNLVYRAYPAIKDVDEVFAISKGLGQDQGTAWTIEMARQLGKTVYVFDQAAGQWFQLKKTGKPVPIDPPSLPVGKSYAGVGTRSINDAGRAAIRALYAGGAATIAALAGGSPAEQLLGGQLPEEEREVQAAGIPGLGALAKVLGRILPEPGPMAALAPADELLRRQRAPVTAVPASAPEVRFQSYVTDRLHPITRYVPELERKHGYTFDPARNPLLVTDNLVNGGFGLAEERFAPLETAMWRASNAGILDQVSQLLSMRGAMREWDTLETKYADLMRRADDAYRMDTREATIAGDRLRAEAGAIGQHLKAGTALPMGMSRATAAAEYDRVLAGLGPLADDARGIVEEIWDIGQQMVKTMDAEGLMLPAEMATFAMRGADYVPMWRIMATFDPLEQRWLRQRFLRHAGLGGKARLSVGEEAVIKEMVGSERENMDPLQAMTKFINEAATEINRNRVARVVLEGYEQARATVGDYGLFIERLKAPPDVVPPDKTVVSYLKNGEPQFFLVDKDFGMAMNFADAESVTGGMRVARGIKTAFHMLAASANPAFAAVQVVKDPFAALMLTNWGGTFDPVLFSKIWLNTFSRHMFDLERGVFAGGLERQMGRPMAAVEREGRLAGAFGGQLGVRIPLEERIPGAVSTVNPLVRGMEMLQERFLTPIEQATKLSTYGTLRKGATPIELAAHETRMYGGSPDFWRYGTGTKSWSDFFMFLNPQVQGIDRMVRRVGTNPEKLIPWAAGMSAALYALGKYNAQFTDPQTGQPEILTVPESERQTNIIIFLPDAAAKGAFGADDEGLIQQATGQARHVYLKIPLAHEYQFLVTPIVHLMQGVGVLPAGKTWSAGQAVADTVSNLVPGSVQLDVDKPISSALRRVGAAANPLFRGPAEFLSGSNFFTGAPIVGTRVENRPPTEQYTRRTDPLIKGIAQNLGKVDFLREKAPYLVSPDRLEYLYRTFFPGLGEMLLTGASAAVRPEPLVQESRPEQLLKVPIAGPFFRRGLQSAHSQVRIDQMSQFYDLAGKVQSASTVLNDELARDPDRLAVLLQQQPELITLKQLGSWVARTQKALGSFDRQRDLLERSQLLQMSPADRAQAMATLYQQEQAVLQEVQTVIDELRKLQVPGV